MIFSQPFGFTSSSSSLWESYESSSSFSYFWKDRHVLRTAVKTFFSFFLSRSGTNNSFGRINFKSMKRIDYIFQKNFTTLSSIHKDLKTPKGRWASDHHPVISVLKLWLHKFKSSFGLFNFINYKFSRAELKAVIWIVTIHCIFSNCM